MACQFPASSNKLCEDTWRKPAISKIDGLRPVEVAVPPNQKITLAEMRSAGVRGLLIYCADFRCSHHVAVLADRWADEVRLSDLEPKCVCTAYGRRRGEIRPDFHWSKEPVAMMGYR